MLSFTLIMNYFRKWLFNPLALLSCMILVLIQQSKEEYARKEQVNLSRLQVLRTITDVTKIACFARCKIEKSCHQFSYNQHNSIGQCILYKRNCEAPSVTLQKTEAYLRVNIFESSCKQ